MFLVCLLLVYRNIIEVFKNMLVTFMVTCRDRWTPYKVVRIWDWWYHIYTNRVWKDLLLIILQSLGDQGRLLRWLHNGWEGKEGRLAWVYFVVRRHSQGRRSCVNVPGRGFHGLNSLHVPKEVPLRLFHQLVHMWVIRGKRRSEA